jgi:DhnA family fructose-bisphosphate aldolase class Ia
VTVLPRLSRLLHPRSGRCIDVAVDHGFFGEPAFLRGIEEMAAVVDALVEAGPEAIQLTVGQARVLQDRPGRDKPALVLRTDVANVYGPRPPGTAFSVLVDDAVGHAVRLDAACVVVNLFDIPGQDDLRRQCLHNVVSLRTACDHAGMPLMVEPLVMRPGEGGYGVDGDADRVTALVRQAAELGADIIKADPTDDLAAYGRVVQAARVPLLVRGGGRVSDEEILVRTAAVVRHGAAGIVYGRNIIQHPRPAAMTRALARVVHDDADPHDAARALEAELAR